MANSQVNLVTFWPYKFSVCETAWVHHHH